MLAYIKLKVAHSQNIYKEIKYIDKLHLRHKTYILYEAIDPACGLTRRQAPFKNGG